MFETGAKAYIKKMQRTVMDSIIRHSPPGAGIALGKEVAIFSQDAANQGASIAWCADLARKNRLSPEQAALAYMHSLVDMMRTTAQLQDPTNRATLEDIAAKLSRVATAEDRRRDDKR